MDMQRGERERQVPAQRTESTALRGTRKKELLLGSGGAAGAPATVNLTSRALLARAQFSPKVPGIFP